MKIVLSGDLHLGRSSSKIPRSWREQNRSISAWRRLVSAVVEGGADLLLLSGDLLDHGNQLWEAQGPFQEGILKLHQAGIRTLAVCGNHDAEALPALAAQLPEDGFKLLGKNGKWERETLRVDGRPVLHIDGWSFPAAIVREDPTLSYPGASGDGIPVLGMVHGDPGVPESHYAPLNLNRLQSLGLSAWLLGHIHRPLLTPGSPWVLMPGSPHPMDPGEPGPHHAWITEVRNGSLQPPEPFCPASLRYEEMTLTLRPEDLPTAEWISANLQQALAEADPVVQRVLRIRLTGVSSHLELLEESCRNLEDWNASGTAVDLVEIAVHPSLDRDQVAKAGPVPALLVDALEDLPETLRERFAVICEELSNQTEFSGKNLPPLSGEDLTTEHLLESILRAGLEQTA